MNFHKVTLPGPATSTEMKRWEISTASHRGALSAGLCCRTLILSAFPFYTRGIIRCVCSSSGFSCFNIAFVRFSRGAVCRDGLSFSRSVNSPPLTSGLFPLWVITEPPGTFPPRLLVHTRACTCLSGGYPGTDLPGHRARVPTHSAQGVSQPVFQRGCAVHPLAGSV